MKLWTYSESLDKITNDNDLQEIFEHDNAFINKNEMIGYFNEALTKASTDIQAKSKDYFLTKAFLPMVTGQKQIALPDNIMANKIRQLRYINGSINYEVTPYSRSQKFADMSFTDQYGPSDYYRYSLMNDYVGQAKIEIHPAPRETAEVPTFNPLTLWYIRNCARVPLIGEFCNPELCHTSQVAINKIAISSLNTIGIVNQGIVGRYVGSIQYRTGDAIRFRPVLGLGNDFLDIDTGVTYYAIMGGDGFLYVALTKLDALNNTPTNLAPILTGYFTIEVMATEAIVAATVLDIPEFNMYLVQFVKCKILAKERDPSLPAELAILQAYNEQMMDTLSDAVQDNNSDDIEADYSAYEELV